MIKRDAVYLNQSGKPCWAGFIMYGNRTLKKEWCDAWSEDTIPNDFRILTKMVEW